MRSVTMVPGKLLAWSNNLVSPGWHPDKALQGESAEAFSRTALYACSCLLHAGRSDYQIQSELVLGQAKAAQAESTRVPAAKTGKCHFMLYQRHLLKGLHVVAREYERATSVGSNLLECCVGSGCASSCRRGSGHCPSLVYASSASALTNA